MPGPTVHFNKRKRKLEYAQPKKAPVAGPYRSQSSVPKVKAKATKREHRTIAPPSPAAKRKAIAEARASIRFRAPTKHVSPTPASVLRAIENATVPASLRNQPSVAQSLHRLDKSVLGDVHLPRPKGALGAALGTIQLVTGGEASTALSAAETGARAASDSKSVAQAVKDMAAAAKTAPKNIARDIKTAPARTVAKAKAAPGAAKRAATTSEGRRAAAKGAGKAAKRHPVRTTYGAAAVSPVPLPGEADKRARAFAEGTAKAVVEHPVETLETTARSLPAAITAPAALIASGAASVIHGTPKPLEKTASEQAKGLGHIVGQAFSGDIGKAERAARKEGSLAMLTPLPAITRLGKYEKARGAMREAANAARGKLAARSDWANRNLRHAPAGTAPHVFGFTARRAERKSGALKHQRAYNPRRFAQGRHEHALTEAISKAPKGSHVALQTVAEYGVRGPAAADLLRRQGPGDHQLLKALDYMDAHPKLWQSKAFEAALNAHERSVEALPAAMVGKGERARLLPQGDLLGVPRPGMRIPHVKREAFGGAKTWHEAVAKVDAAKQGQQANLRLAKRQVAIAKSGLEQTRKTWARLKAQAKRFHDNGGIALSPEAQKSLATTEGAYKLAQRRYKQAKVDLKARASDGVRLAELRKEAKARGRGTLKNEARYDSRLLHEYAQEVETARQGAGLARAVWTPHSAGERMAGLQNRFPTAVGRKEHMRRGGYALENNLDRSLEGMVKGTRAARERAAGKQFGRDLAEERLPFTLDGQQRYVIRDHKDWEAITARKSPENPNGGQFDPKSVGRLAIREVNNAIEDPFMSEAQKQAALYSLLKEAEEGKTKGGAPSILLPRELIREALAQIHPEHSPVTRGMNVLARVSNRTILGTNPGWAMAQTAAEGIPLILAKPSLLLNGPALLKDLARYRHDHPEEHAALEATAGASPHSAAAVNTPLDQATPQTFAQGAKALTRGKGARAALSIASFRALGELDRKRQNTYRTVLLAAEADKRFRSFHSSLVNLFDRQSQLSGRFKTRADLWNYLTQDPKGAKERIKLENYVDNIQGNWTAFTHYERAFAPFTIFYPFLRYSLRWTLWTFPKTHPTTATLTYMLGQANSNQLEKLAGGKLSSPFAYAYPAYSTVGGKAVLPGGSRISPGQSSLTQALATGNPAQVLSSANPFLGAGITALTGVEPLSGEKSSLPRGEAALNALLSMPAPLRLAGVKLGGQSAASKAYEGFDKNKKLRSLAVPFLPQSAAKFHGAERLSREFATKYGKGNVPGPFDSKLVQELLYGGPNGTPQPKMLPKVLAEIHKSEAASNVVKKAEEPTYGKSKPFSAVQKQLLEAIENAWQTGPSATSGSGGKYSGAFGTTKTTGSGGKYSGAFGSSSAGSAKPGKYSGAFGP